MKNRQERNQEITKQLTSGTKTASIARKFGVSIRTVQMVAKTNGLERKRGNGPKTFKNPEQALADYLAGLSIQEVAERQDIGAKAASRELLLAGVPIRPGQHYLRRFTDAQEEQMAELYLSGATLAEISYEFGHGDKELTRAVLVRRGVPRRSMKETRDMRGTWNTGRRRSKVEWP